MVLVPGKTNVIVGLLFWPGQEPRAPTRVAAVHRTRKGLIVGFFMLDTSKLSYLFVRHGFLVVRLAVAVSLSFCCGVQHSFLAGSLSVLQAPHYILVNKHYLIHLFNCQSYTVDVHVHCYNDDCAIFLPTLSAPH